MSMFVHGEPRVQDATDAVTSQVPKCRIPQRLPPGRERQSFNKTKEGSSPEWVLRPKSANRGRDDHPISGRLMNTPNTRVTRPEREKLQPVPRRPTTIQKRVTNETVSSPNKTGRPVITVPITQKQTVKISPIRTSGLPTQDKIMKSEEQELHQRELSGAIHILNDLNNRESITSRSDKVMQLKIVWQEMLIQFEKMNTDLKERQKAIMELYANMCSVHQKMRSIGHKVNLPSAEDLHIMNVAKMTPEQLLQLCAGGDPRHHDEKGQDDLQLIAHLSIDINKLYNMPTKLVATCQHTLIKRKEIIDWFESLKSVEKGISTKALSKKIHEFNAENDMLQCSLDQVQIEFGKELENIIDYLRKGVNETIALQLRAEELTYKVSELNSQNADLKKQIHNTSQLKSQTNKGRIEELEKELKEEKCKKVVIRERLSRAEGQIKIGVDRAVQLEAALEQARSQSWALERTVQHLHEQNKKLQSDFDKELNKLTESIRENTSHLEEIADAREKLQAEKEDLEKRLAELSDNYNESLKNVKHEMNVNVSKFIETEKKHAEDLEVKKDLETKVESLCAQLLESELRCKDLSKELQEKETQLNKAIDYDKELEGTKKELELLRGENEDYRNQLVKQNESIKEIESKFEETIDLQANLKSDLSNKEEYIAELEKQQSLLEQQLQESEFKMQSYEEQLTSLKHHIQKLQKDFGEFENRDSLHEMINQQQKILADVTRQKEELTEALESKEIELQRHVQNFSEQEQILEQREGILKMLYEKQEEHCNIIKLLRNNLEMRSQAETELSQQLVAKNAEISSLAANVETRKQQISQLEKIILTLEDQIQQYSSREVNDQDNFTSLDKNFARFEPNLIENKHRIKVPTENLDDLIKILENELESSFESPSNARNNQYVIPKKKCSEDQKREKPSKFDSHNAKDGSRLIQAEHESIPTKILLSKYVKKSCISTNGEQIKGDNLDRKKTLTKIETQKWASVPEPSTHFYDAPTIAADSFTEFKEHVPVALPDHTIKRNIQFLNSQKLRNDKKCKMFKFAGHKL